MKVEAKKNQPDGQMAARQIVEDFETDDVFLIAASVGLKITYENWFPITAGEFDKRKKTIFVNKSAAESDVKIIAHELGHFFAQNLDLDHAKEEIFAREFAENFIKIEN